MSKASNQALALLATISGAMHMIEAENLGDKIMPTVLYSKDTTDACIFKYPTTGDEYKNYQWMHLRMEAWQHRVNDLEGKWTAIILVSIATQIITDLGQKIQDKNKLQLIAPVEEALKGLSDLIDPTGDQYNAYNKANDLLADLYKRLEFVV